MHYNLEFGGGLGDVLDQMYANGAYHTLRDLGEDDTATVYLITHNPFAAELFLNHPNRDRIKVEVLPYWHPDQDRAERTIRNMPPMGMNQYLPVKYGGVEFFPGPASVDLLRQVVPFDYLVLAAGAGMQERVLPDPVLHLILGTITALTNMPIYAIGRTYTREGRYEPVTDGYPTVVNWVDRLDVPGTCQLVQNAAGLITALDGAAWLARGCARTAGVSGVSLESSRAEQPRRSVAPRHPVEHDRTRHLRPSPYAGHPALPRHRRPCLTTTTAMTKG